MYRSALLLSLSLIACSSQRDRITAQGTIEVDETDIIPPCGGGSPGSWWPRVIW
jgi:hypothetical protein